MGAPVTPSSINSISQVIQRAIGKDRCSLRLHSSLESTLSIVCIQYCKYVLQVTKAQPAARHEHKLPVTMHMGVVYCLYCFNAGPSSLASMT
jgi:hypothetical protein